MEDYPYKVYAYHDKVRRGGREGGRKEGREGGRARIMIGELTTSLHIIISLTGCRARL